MSRILLLSWQFKFKIYDNVMNFSVQKKDNVMNLILTLVKWVTKVYVNHRLGFQRSIKHDMIGDGIDDPPKDFNKNKYKKVWLLYVILFLINLIFFCL